ncbi:Cytochrome b561 domain-containing protein 2 [Oopsacas minuta]|uniref:Cytochrome b561 domain-containing protein 2 n=1 Tax=Oopsacas minuta TaxID=111878 RepID=A0AAV7JHJ0_9METZ|nr:Cytochrome b561 domain-containing protein 2 [Oopsacas minuta]
MSKGVVSEEEISNVETGSTFRKVTSENHIPALSSAENGKAKWTTQRSNVPKAFRIIFAVTAHVVLLIGVGEPFYLLKPPLNDQTEYSVNILFKWHVCCSVMLVAIFTESIWVFSGSIGLFPFWGPTAKFRAHVFIYLISYVWCFAGWYVASFNHFLAGRPYYASWHGILGLILNIYMIVNWLAGCSLLYDRIRTNFVMEIYIWSLVLILTAMAVVVYTSMFSFWFTRTFYGASWHLHFFVLVGWYLYTLVTLLTIRNQVYV